MVIHSYIAVNYYSMSALSLQRITLLAVLLWPFGLVLPSLQSQSLPFYKTEKVIVGESWLKNINTSQPPRILKFPEVGHASFNRAGKGYVLSYNNRGIAEYDTIVFSADGKIHAYALKNKFLRTKEDYFILESGTSAVLDVLANDETYSQIHLSSIPFEEGVYATIQNNKVHLETNAPGLYHFYYTACDGSGHCDEAKATVFVTQPNKPHDTIVLSRVLDQQLRLPLPGTDFELVHATIDHVYPDGNGYFDIDLFKRDLGENEILFQSKQGQTLLYRINFVDIWEENHLNTGDKVYVHPDKSINVSLTDNDFWVNIYSLLPTSSDLQLTNSGGGRVTITPRSGFSGKASFQYVTCAFPRCDTTTVEVYVDHFKPAQEHFDFHVDPAVPYHIPFYTPSKDYQLSIQRGPKKGVIEVVDQGRSLKYIPNPGFTGEDMVKINYSYQNNAGGFKSSHTLRFLPSPHPFQGNCTDCVWPGDADGNGVVDMADIGPIARYIGEQGPSRSQGAVWKGQWSYPWMNFEHKNLNHFDANGDGLISNYDLQVIIDHMGQTHGLYTAPVTLMDVPVVVDPSNGSAAPGDELTFEFIIGDKEHQLYNVTGFSTDVKIEGHTLSSESVDVVRDEKIWLKSHQPTMSLKAPGSDDNQVAAGEYRVRSVGVKGFGTALKLHIIVEDEVEGFRTQRARTKAIKFIFSNLKIHTANGVFALPDQIFELPWRIDEKSNSSESNELEVYPNPAQEQVSVRWPEVQKDGFLEIMDLTGKKVSSYELSVGASKTEVGVEDLAPGIYILRFKSGDKTWNQKLSIIR